MKALKEQEEKQLEQDNDELMYTYARDNERKVTYKYTSPSVQNSLVASELGRDKKNFTGSRSSFFSPPILLSPISISSSTSPLPLSPPLSPTLIKRLSLTITTDSQMVPSPPSVLTGEPISNSHVDVYIHSPVLLDIDLDLLSYSKDNISNGKMRR